MYACICKIGGFAGILDRLMMNQIMRRLCGVRLEFISRILANGKRTKHVRYIAQLDISGLIIRKNVGYFRV